MLGITPGGKELLMRTLAGDASLEFTNIRLGDGTDAGAATDSSECTATALSHVRNTMEVTNTTAKDVTIEITAGFSNTSVTAAYRATEIGVYCKDPDDSTSEILYAYEYTPAAEAEYIPAAVTGHTLEIQRVMQVYIGEATDVRVYIATSGYVTPAELAAHTGNTANPHQTDAEQIGLGNVPNVATNDQTPTYEEAETLAEPESGEKLSTALGKIKKAVKTLIAHIGTTAQNAHGETPASIGAAAASHTHAASDIVTGILSVVRGGTGVASISALAALLLEPTLTLKTYTGDIDNITTPGIVWANAGASNHPGGCTQGMVITNKTEYGGLIRSQIYISTEGSSNLSAKIYIRQRTSGNTGWNDWYRVTTDNRIFQSLLYSGSLNEMGSSSSNTQPDPALYYLSGATDGPTGFSGDGWCALIKYNTAWELHYLQIIYDGSDIYLRIHANSSNAKWFPSSNWGSWRKISTEAVS